MPFKSVPISLLPELTWLVERFWVQSAHAGNLAKRWLAWAWTKFHGGIASFNSLRPTGPDLTKFPIRQADGEMLGQERPAA